jgi:hypothetical protein
MRETSERSATIFFKMIFKGENRSVIEIQFYHVMVNIFKRNMKKQQEGRMCCVPSRMITEGLSEE